MTYANPETIALNLAQWIFCDVVIPFPCTGDAICWYESVSVSTKQQLVNSIVLVFISSFFLPTSSVLDYNAPIFLKTSSPKSWHLAQIPVQLLSLISNFLPAGLAHGQSSEGGRGVRTKD